jgi:NAD(P)-dependent dehydrogenase (short-subunit alcohol dehydrogenase family)
MGRVSGKIALITGAGSGIGRTAAILFAREGSQVVVADIGENEGRQTVAKIEALGGQALFVHMDVTLADSVEAAFHAAVQRFGRLDILYNNVGGTNPKDGPITDVSLEVLEGSLRRDLLGTMLCCRFGIREMLKSGGGAVVNTASVVALMGKPAPAQEGYTAAKGAIVAMTRSMAVHYAPHRIRINAIAPGLTLTDRIQRRLAQGAIPKAFLERQLLGLVEPIDVAQAALFLASNEARAITGHTLPVDGGMSMS